MNTDYEARHTMVAIARIISARSLTHSTTGNVSVRVGDRILITPTGSSLATVEPDDLSGIDENGNHVGGPKPSKEAFVHAAVLRARPQDNAVIHTHSTHAAAVSCLDGLDSADALPAFTAYFAMRVGKVPLLAYHAPGDQALGPIVQTAAVGNRALLLSHHGPIVAGVTLDSALECLEELEENAKLYFLLAGYPTRPLSPEQVAALRR